MEISKGIISLTGNNLNALNNVLLLMKKSLKKEKAEVLKKTFKGLTVSEELKLNQKKENETRLVQSLELAGLSKEYLNRRISSLSDSEKDRLRLSIIFEKNPKVFLLNNPTRYLDKENKIKLIKLLKKLNKRYNKRVVIVTNDPDILLVSDQIKVFENETLVEEGSKYDILFNERITKKYHINIPIIIELQKLIQKRTRIIPRDNINDLIKDIYRYLE